MVPRAPGATVLKLSPRSTFLKGSGGPRTFKNHENMKKDQKSLENLLKNEETIFLKLAADHFGGVGAPKLCLNLTFRPLAGTPGKGFVEKGKHMREPRAAASRRQRRRERAGLGSEDRAEQRPHHSSPGKVDAASAVCRDLKGLHNP